MTAEDNLKLVRKIVEGYAQGNINIQVRDYYAEDVEWIISGSEQDRFVGRYRGLDEVEKVFDLFNKTTDLQYLPEEYVAQGDKVVVLGKEIATFKPCGRVVETSFAEIFTVRDGKIVKFHAIIGYP